MTAHITGDSTGATGLLVISGPPNSPASADATTFSGVSGPENTAGASGSTAGVDVSVSVVDGSSDVTSAVLFESSALVSNDKARTCGAVVASNAAPSTVAVVSVPDVVSPASAAPAPTPWSAAATGADRAGSGATGLALLRVTGSPAAGARSAADAGCDPAATSVGGVDSAGPGVATGSGATAPRAFPVVSVCVEEVSAPPLPLQLVLGPVSDSPVFCVGEDCPAAPDALGVFDGAAGFEPVGLLASPAGAAGPSDGTPPEGEFGDADTEFDGEFGPDSSARATPGLLATQVAIPSAAANAPTRPIYRAHPMVIFLIRR